MSDDSGFKELLWRELVAADLIPTSEHYRQVAAELARCGSAERDSVRSLVGAFTWRCGLLLSGVARPRHAAIRILGWGRALTEFFVAPIDLPDADYSSVTSLGALANLIVTLYDSYVEHGLLRRNPLPRHALDAVAGGARQELRQPRPFFSIPFRVMTTLVAAYFHRLHELPYAARRPEVRQLIGHAIMRMYDAENETLHEQRSRRAVWRKSVYPFVVMGLPAWLAAPVMDFERYWWHLRWLFRLGAFYAWIDDAIDLRHDLKKRHPNLVAGSLPMTGGDGQKEADMARKIAGEGRRVMSEWQTRVEEGQANPSPMASHAFSACLASWFDRPS